MMKMHTIQPESCLTKPELVKVIKEKAFFSSFANRIESQIREMAENIVSEESITPANYRLNEWLREIEAEPFGRNLRSWRPEDEEKDILVYHWQDEKIPDVTYYIIGYPNKTYQFEILSDRRYERERDFKLYNSLFDDLDERFGIEYPNISKYRCSYCRGSNLVERTIYECENCGSSETKCLDCGARESSAWDG